MRRRVRDWLLSLSERLCGPWSRNRPGVFGRWTFEAGHWIGELGWMLRGRDGGAS